MSDRSLFFTLSLFCLTPSSVSPLHFETVSQPLKTPNCHSKRSEESNGFNKLENRDSSPAEGGIRMTL